MQLDRREFLAQAAALPAIGGGVLRLRALDLSGSPVPEAFQRTLLLIDSSGRPFELLPRRDADGLAVIDVPREKFEICMVLPVRDFGQVCLYADDGGLMYTPGENAGRELLLNFEFARSRAAFVERYVEKARAEGVQFSPEVTGRLERGGAALHKAAAAEDDSARAAFANDSLTDTMWAGEIAALERARHRTARRGVRPGFLFGCSSFAYGPSDEYRGKFGALFNFATIPLYRAVYERVEGQTDYAKIDANIYNTVSPGMLLKGHPLVYFNEAGAPAFLRNRPWQEVKLSCRDYILRTVGRYRDRIHSWDVINEAHDWANDLNLSDDQLLEATRLAAESTREADATAFRIVNSCCTWGQYVARRRSYSGPLNRRARTPLEYIRALEAADVPFEAIGLQLYYEARDLLETERQIERFFALRKPIHITELGIASSSDPVQKGPNRTPDRNVWHGQAWSEKIQADWVEQLYTIFYSKPEIQAISWWSFADPSFNPHQGLLDADLRPKEAYTRLSRLLASWRGAEPSRDAVVRTSANYNTAAMPEAGEGPCTCSMP